MSLGKPKNQESHGKWLEVDASTTGTLAFKDPVNLQINGKFEGSLITRGNLSIGEKAQVKATIEGESITISGSVEGQVTATTRLELSSTARLTGKAISPRVVMQEGAVLQGTLEMLSVRGPGSSLMNVDELARYLEVDSSTVVDWAQSGRLPAEREGQNWRFELSKIEEWLAHEKVK